MIFCWFTSLIDPCGMYLVNQDKCSASTILCWFVVLVNSYKMCCIAFKAIIIIVRSSMKFCKALNAVIKVISLH